MNTKSWWKNPVQIIKLVYRYSWNAMKNLEWQIKFGMALAGLETIKIIMRKVTFVFKPFNFCDKNGVFSIFAVSHQNVTFFLK